MERDRRSEELHRKKALFTYITNHDEEREKKPKDTTLGGGGGDVPLGPWNP